MSKLQKICNYLGKLLHLHRLFKDTRGVAQSGSAPGLGPGGRRFESCHPDFGAATKLSFFI